MKALSIAGIAMILVIFTDSGQSEVIVHEKEK
jgi:hypothetical protein